MMLLKILEQHVKKQLEYLFQCSSCSNKFYILNKKMKLAEEKVDFIFCFTKKRIQIGILPTVLLHTRVLMKMNETSEKFLFKLIVVKCGG